MSCPRCSSRASRLSSVDRGPTLLRVGLLLLSKGLAVLSVDAAELRRETLPPAITVSVSISSGSKADVAESEVIEFGALGVLRVRWPVKGEVPEERRARVTDAMCFDFAS